MLQLLTYRCSPLSRHRRPATTCSWNAAAAPHPACASWGSPWKRCSAAGTARRPCRYEGTSAPSVFWIKHTKHVCSVSGMAYRSKQLAHSSINPSSPKMLVECDRVRSGHGSGVGGLCLWTRRPHADHGMRLESLDARIFAGSPVAEHRRGGRRQRRPRHAGLDPGSAGVRFGAHHKSPVVSLYPCFTALVHIACNLLEGPLLPITTAMHGCSSFVAAVCELAAPC